jgi:hypothetical protein
MTRTRKFLAIAAVALVDLTGTSTLEMAYGAERHNR